MNKRLERTIEAVNNWFEDNDFQPMSKTDFDNILEKVEYEARHRLL